jgi:hypothetical protein
MCCHKLIVPHDYPARQAELANSSLNGKNGDREQVQNLHPHMSTKCVTLLSTFRHLVVSNTVWIQPLFTFLRWIGRFVWDHTYSTVVLPLKKKCFSDDPPSFEQLYQVQPHPCMQQIMLLIFWFNMVTWESIIHIVNYMSRDIGRDANDFLPRRQRRQFLQQAKHHHHTKWSRLPPLIFLPMLWMVLTNVIVFPARANLTSPIENMGQEAYMFSQQAYHRITRLDEMVTLNLGTFVQFNKMKANSLRDLLGLASKVSTGATFMPSSVPTVHSNQPNNEWTNDIDTVDQPMQHQANGPIVVTDNNATLQKNMMGNFDEPCAFMTFSQEQHQPVIFDTGASLAITHDKSDFSGPITASTTDLRLGGMANGLRIEGIGPVTWTFRTATSAPITVKGMAYYVPQAKARLLSPQRLCHSKTGQHGRFEGDHQSFRLCFDGQPPLVIEYDERNSLPIGYATFHEPATGPTDLQLNLVLISDLNQNMTAGQKLLLQWHYRFGHLNFPAVQRILRAVPFLFGKFEAASKCDSASLKCAICEYAKGHRRARHHVHQVTNQTKVGALTIEHLKPGAQVSVDHFESRLLGRTFDSYGKASSATYKGGCVFVDHCSG